MSGFQHPQALLLLGPTGSGKTPLGQMLEARGLCGIRCAHFDFGENLRAVVAGDSPDAMISQTDIDFLQGILATGALLEDEHFPIAERILRRFLAQHTLGATAGLSSSAGNTVGQANRGARYFGSIGSLVILNGLPRHVGQARAIDAILEVHAVVCLECSGETVMLRLESNIGGDRDDRSDDTLDQVRMKLDVYRRRTTPLVEHYSRKNVRIKSIEVTPAMTPVDAWQILASSKPLAASRE